MGESVGEGVKKCGGMWKRCGGVETKCWERCKIVCWGRCGKVLWGVGKGQGRCAEVWESVLGCGKGKKSVGMWEIVGCWEGVGKVCWDVEDVEKCWEGCEKMCWSVGGCVGVWGEVLKEVCWGFPCLPSHSFYFPHTPTHLSNLLHLSPTLSHNPLTSRLTSFTPQHTFHSSFHIFP